VPRHAKSILGAKVNIQGDMSVGTVEDLVFSDDGYVDYLVVVNGDANTSWSPGRQSSSTLIVTTQP
jgi:hypothetical protein